MSIYLYIYLPLYLPYRYVSINVSVYVYTYLCIPRPALNRQTQQHFTMAHNLSEEQKQENATDTTATVVFGGWDIGGTYDL